MDVALTPGINYNSTKGVSSFAFSDLPVGIDFQLYKTLDEKAKWAKFFLFTIQEVLPTGKYNNLDLNKRFTDAGGLGSWQTQFLFSWGNCFHLGKFYYLTWLNALTYNLCSSVKVKNLNIYGGGKGTRGTVYPGHSIELDTAIQLTLSRHWAFSLDAVGVWTASTKFKGTTEQPNSNLASILFSLAPALEYNFNENLGLIAGCWFSVAGKNSSQFASGAIALNYYR